MTVMIQWRKVSENMAPNRQHFCSKMSYGRIKLDIQNDF